MNRIIFVTDLTLWSMGNGNGGPAFTQTIKKYIDEQWDVWLVSDVPSNAEYPALNTDRNIIVPESCFKNHIGKRLVGFIFRLLNHLAISKRFELKIKEILQSNQKNTILYAYEIFGVKACSKMAKKRELPFVTRFQGTILSQYKNNLTNHVRLYPHYQAIAQKADLVIMTDDGTKGLEVLHNLKNDSKKLFLRNGLNLLEQDIDKKIAEFNRESFRKKLKSDVTDEDNIFLTVSRLVHWKKVERAIDGFADFRKNGGKGILVIVGDGDGKKALIERTQQRGIKDDVIFTGSVPHDSVYDYMIACDIFISLYDLSNVGNPLLEAMTLGKCIITLDVGDTNKIIKNRENGILLAKDTLSKLGMVMYELSSNNNLKMQLGKQAAKYARDNFYSWGERMNLEYENVKQTLQPDKTRGGGVNA